MLLLVKRSEWFEAKAAANGVPLILNRKCDFTRESVAKIRKFGLRRQEKREGEGN
jgi:hypothetical protein